MSTEGVLGENRIHDSATPMEAIDNEDKESVQDEGSALPQQEEPSKSKEAWTEDDLKEAIRRINAGEIDFKEAENVYGISPRTIHRQRAIENMRAQLNPEKAKKAKPTNPPGPKKDVTILRKPVSISTSTADILGLLNSGTEEVRQLLNYECDLIYECKVCRNLFRSLANFISHKRIYCCDLYSSIHSRSDDNCDKSELTTEENKAEKLKAKENIREFATKPFRVTCRKDITSILKRITNINDMIPSEPILHLQSTESTPYALQQILYPKEIRETITLKPQDPESNENKELVHDTEPQDKESSVPEKKHEKTVQSDKHFVAEKRFRCPVCHSNFTIRRSVLRHLKSVHHKSIEQVEKLKSRIQIHFVRIRNSSAAETNKDKEKQEDRSVTTRSSRLSLDNKAENWEKPCPLCRRKFIDKDTFAAHVKLCRRHSSSSSDTSTETSPKNPMTLIPVISLTPIAASSYTVRSEPETSTVIKSTSTGTSSMQTRKATSSSSSSSKKVSLPLASTVSSNAQSKKIGIQVRMNYCKDGVASSSNSVNGNSYANSSYTPTQSNENSRRSSMVSIKDANDQEDWRNDALLNVVRPHNTRSGSRLAGILDSLLDKQSSQSVKTDGETLPVKSNAEEGKEVSAKKSEANDVTIYCDNCCNTYALNEFCCDDVPRDDVTLTYRCALPNCDFFSASIGELLPHLSAKHPVLSENALTNVTSVFVAEHVKQNDAVAIVCHRKRHERPECSSGSNTRTRRKDNVAAATTGKVSVTTSEETQTINVPSSILNKRKSTPVNKVVGTKRKNPSSEVKHSPGVVKTATEKVLETKAKTQDVLPAAVKVESNEDNRLCDNATPAFGTGIKANNVKVEESAGTESRVHDLPSVKKPKLVRKESLKLQAKKSTTADTTTSESSLVNGVVRSSSSSDEENDKSQVKPKMKVNYNKSFKKHIVPTVDAKSYKTPQKRNTSTFHNEVSSSSSTPDSDIDQAVIIDENLKKSIMTIIFGKELSAEKVEENVSNREKSPTSSSSSECGKEKRYSFRIAKQIVPVDVTIEDKSLKASNPNKSKPSSR